MVLSLSRPLTTEDSLQELHLMHFTLLSWRATAKLIGRVPSLTAAR
jgi:hypothetical protein